MRYRQAGTLAALAMLALVGGACGLQGGADVAASAEPSFATSSLPCRTTEQTGVIWDYPGPGQPTPEEAVVPFAGALTLVVLERDGKTEVLGLKPDGTVFRVFQVTKQKDGWWADGYRECSG